MISHRKRPRPVLFCFFIIPKVGHRMMDGIFYLNIWIFYLNIWIGGGNLIIKSSVVVEWKEREISGQRVCSSRIWIPIWYALI